MQLVDPALCFFVHAQDSTQSQKLNNLEKTLSAEQGTQSKQSEKTDNIDKKQSTSTLIEFDRKIDESDGKKRLKLIFEDFKRTAQTYLSEAQNHRQVQSELFSLKYQDKSQLIEKGINLLLRMPQILRVISVKQALKGSELFLILTLHTLNIHPTLCIALVCYY